MENVSMYEATINDASGVGFTINGVSNLFYCFATKEWHGDAIRYGRWEDMTEDEVSETVEEYGLDPMALTVENTKGVPVIYAQAYDAMEQELRDKAISIMGPCVPSMLFVEYAILYRAKYGTDWEFDKGEE